MTDQDEPIDAPLAPDSISWGRLIREAARAHPAFRYATVVAGLGAFVALFYQFGPSPGVLVIGIIVLLALMVAFLMFAVMVELARHGKGQAQNAALVFMWVMTTLVLLSASATFLSTFANWPLPLRAWLVEQLNLPQPDVLEAPPENLDATYVGEVESQIGGRTEISHATVRLQIAANVVAGSYTNNLGDKGTISGKLDGNSLTLMFSSSVTPGDCSMSANLSRDRSTLEGVYRCKSNDPKYVEGASLTLKRRIDP
jgi:hypothetical protein